MSEETSWRRSIAVYIDRRVAVILLLELATVTPAVFVVGAAQDWFGDRTLLTLLFGISGFLTVSALLRIVLGTIVDCVALPGLTRIFGRRRSWMVSAQLLNILAAAALLLIDPKAMPVAAGLLVGAVVLLNALLEAVIDAFRIEIASPRRQGALAAMQEMTARLFPVFLIAVGLPLAPPDLPTAAVLGLFALMIAGLAVAIAVNEPTANANFDSGFLFRQPRIRHLLEAPVHLSAAGRHITAWLMGLVICPTADFFERHGKSARLHLLLLVSLALASQETFGTSTTFLSGTFVPLDASRIIGAYKLPMAVVGALAGGVLVFRLGVARMVPVAFAILLAAKLLDFLPLVSGYGGGGFALAVSAHNFATTMAIVVLIAYASSLCVSAFTASQYALIGLIHPAASVIVFGVASVLPWQSPLSKFLATVAFCLIGLWQGAKLSRTANSPGETDAG